MILEKTRKYEVIQINGKLSQQRLQTFRYISVFQEQYHKTIYKNYPKQQSNFNFMTLDMGIYELRAEVFIAKKETIECTCVQCHGLRKKGTLLFI